jgi:hypothetical protein
MNEDEMMPLIDSYVDEINGGDVSPIWNYIEAHPEHEAELTELMEFFLRFKLLYLAAKD